MGDKVVNRTIASLAGWASGPQARIRTMVSFGLFGASLAVLCLPGMAQAQTSNTPPQNEFNPTQKEQIERNRALETQEVTERKQPGYEPLGIRLGAFMINPGLDILATYTDNLYSSKDDKKADFFTTINPSVYVQSNWTAHQLELWASGRFLRYLEYSDEGTNNFDTYARGKFDIARGSWVALRPFYTFDHETRGSPDAVTGGLEPIEVVTRGIDFTAEHKPTRLWFAADASLKEMTFTNSLLAGGGVVNNADRDRREAAGGVRVGYELTPGYSAYVEGRANDRKYESAVDDLGYRRDSSGYETRLGAQVELTGKLKGLVYLGYLWQDYVDPRFEAVSGPVFGAGLTWNATGLTTVKVKAARSIEETTINRAAGALQNVFELSVDHELQRNIILSAGGKYTQQDFRGVDRNYDVYEANLKATYQINRSYKVTGGYTYNHRAANVAASEYSTNTVFVGFASLF